VFYTFAVTLDYVRIICGLAFTSSTCSFTICVKELSVEYVHPAGQDECFIVEVVL